MITISFTVQIKRYWHIYIKVDTIVVGEEVELKSGKLVIRSLK